MNENRLSEPILLTDLHGLPFTQADVDFVVPNLHQDTHLCIDPFLLFKSRVREYREAHDRLLSVFNEAIHLYASGDRDRASQLLVFPEVNEVNLGYRMTRRPGSGMGEQLNRLLLETLGTSPELVSRGVRHVEEMQLVSLGIGPDRVSDMSANLLKSFLIEYTQRQAEIYGIPLVKGVPVEHVFDYDDWDWRDDYYDLPVNPLDPARPGIILVPRRIVRKLPWINFDDFQRTEFGLFLRARQLKNGKMSGGSQQPLNKSDIVAVTKREVERIDHYVDSKESASRDADPDMQATATPEFRSQCQDLIAELTALEPGRAQAYEYQQLMLRILNVIFEPELIEGQEQVRTEHGTEIRDLVYINDSDKSFWDYVRNHHGSLSIVFECKNTNKVNNDDINQLAVYLGDAMGYLGILLTRKDIQQEQFLKCIAVYNKGNPHRVVIALSDADLIRMLQMRATGNDPTEVVRTKYRTLLAKVQ